MSAAHDAGGPAGELRLDPLTRQWVTIVAGRQDRPNLAGDATDSPATCPFCVGGLEAPEPYQVRAFANRWPAYAPGPPIDVAGALADGTGFVSLPARGAAEVVLYAPDHTASLATIGKDGARRVVDLWAQRTAALLARPEIEYVLVFENRGAVVGATIPHPHGQIYAFPFVPPVPQREAAVASEHGCTVCAAVRDERAAGTRVVHDDGGWITYVPFASGYPYGVVLAPGEHHEGLPDLNDASRDGLAAALVDVVGRYDRLFDRELPYLMWVHHGVHVHVHFAPPLRSSGAQRYMASGEVGSGTLGNPVAPEAAAAAFRDA